MKVISAKDYGSRKVIRVCLNPDDPEYVGQDGLRQKLTVAPGPTRPERSTTGMFGSTRGPAPRCTKLLQGTA